MTRGNHDISGLFDRAGEVLVTLETRQKYEHWEDAIGAPAARPSPPNTRDEATPHVLLRGPFEGDAALVGVAFYVGIGFVEVRAFNATHCTYETTVIAGDGVEERDAFLTAALRLFFHDVDFTRSPQA